MGVETPIPPKMINAAAPDGAPPRRIKTVEKKIFAGFHGPGVNRIGSCAFLQNIIFKSDPDFDCRTGYRFFRKIDSWIFSAEQFKKKIPALQ